jgi:exodeoxyribonuclease V alpha subunit
MSPRGGRAELVVVDEASMLDLDIAAALLRALPDGAELLLVGDAGQLAAVEAGAVFAEACAHPWPESAGPVHERLLGSHRYAADSPVARLAAALRQGDADAAAAWGGTLRLGQPAQPADLEAAFGLGLSPYVERLRDPSATPADWLAARRLFMVLAAQHSGPRGVVALNRQIGHWMQRRLGMTPARDGTRPWPGRALLVQKNDPATGLANGDIGVVMPRPGGAGGAHGGSGDAGAWQVWFDDAAGGARAIAYERLPEHADAFAMTVHKAQGSEADTVLVLLPPADQARREWLYTATTRARRRLWLAGEPAALAQAALRPTPRDGGLGLRLQAALATGSDVSADPV